MIESAQGPYRRDHIVPRHHEVSRTLVPALKRKRNARVEELGMILPIKNGSTIISPLWAIGIDGQ